MATPDLHSKMFGPSTLLKLEIFEAYAKSWIPPFVMEPKVREIRIFDFFAGPGYDANSIPGSPIRLLYQIREHSINIKKTNTKITLYFNEMDVTKYNLLIKNCENYISHELDLRNNLQIKFFNKDCNSLFFELLPEINLYPSLVFLDQYGVKFISKPFLSELEKLNTTDFLYFVSSSIFKRFSEQLKDILDIDKAEVDEIEPRNIHRFISQKVQLQFAPNSQVKLIPFSIMNSNNIYGIIFGAKHPLAIDKFLRIAWKLNSVNGEANFDIDNDQNTQVDLFDGVKMTKLEKFQQEFKTQILLGHLPDNKSALQYIYNNGHLPSHGDKVLRELKSENKIDYEGNSPKVNYNNVFKLEKIIKYTLK